MLKNTHSSTRRMHIERSSHGAKTLSKRVRLELDNKQCAPPHPVRIGGQTIKARLPRRDLGFCPADPESHSRPHRAAGKPSRGFLNWPVAGHAMDGYKENFRDPNLRAFSRAVCFSDS
ncbi:unnamed protein product [Phytophthora fragariaefolia]|uniref:Unnamed protein product n=1 Tax=Phytophthora fragariaefolia TaxID=1490495 RepID=A0A9W7D9S9_9STRA|nr:unnamed protein product [Phytophthora fragariaefolia]